MKTAGGSALLEVTHSRFHSFSRREEKRKFARRAPAMTLYLISASTRRRVQGGPEADVSG